MRRHREQTFLDPMLTLRRARYGLVNARSHLWMARAMELAVDRSARRTGLLGRDGLPRDGALVLAPCFAIHTAFMRFTIDAVFVARDGRVLKCCPGVAPWRIAIAIGAFAAIELPAGAIARSDTRPGDRITTADAACMALLVHRPLTAVPFVHKAPSLY